MSSEHHMECLCGICNSDQFNEIDSCTCCVCDPDRIKYSIIHNKNLLWDAHSKVCDCYLTDHFATSCQTYLHPCSHWIDCDCGACDDDYTRYIGCRCPIHKSEFVESSFDLADSKISPWGKLVEINGDTKIYQDKLAGFTVHAENEIIFAISLDDARAAVQEIIAAMPKVESKSEDGQETVNILRTCERNNYEVILTQWSYKSDECTYKVTKYKNGKPVRNLYFEGDGMGLMIATNCFRSISERIVYCSESADESEDEGIDKCDDENSDDENSDS